MRLYSSEAFLLCDWLWWFFWRSHTSACSNWSRTNWNQTDATLVTRIWKVPFNYKCTFTLQNVSVCAGRSTSTLSYFYICSFLTCKPSLIVCLPVQKTALTFKVRKVRCGRRLGPHGETYWSSYHMGNNHINENTFRI